MKQTRKKKMSPNEISLPYPKFDSDFSIEKALFNRRSVRYFKKDPLTIDEASQLLWSAQGITNEKKGYRTAPSAGATYPLETYLAVGKVKDLAAGLYQYIPGEHKLIKVKDGDLRKDLAKYGILQPAHKRNRKNR